MSQGNYIRGFDPMNHFAFLSMSVFGSEMSVCVTDILLTLQMIIKHTLLIAGRIVIKYREYHPDLLLICFCQVANELTQTLISKNTITLSKILFSPINNANQRTLCALHYISKICFIDTREMHRMFG